MEEDRYYFHLPKEPISDKNLLIHFLAEMIVYLTKHDGCFEQLKSLNNSQMRQLYDGLLEEWGYNAKRVLNDSIVLCYNGKSIFGVNSLAMNEFLTDLRNKIKLYK